MLLAWFLILTLLGGEWTLSILAPDCTGGRKAFVSILGRAFSKGATTTTNTNGKQLNETRL